MYFAINIEPNLTHLEETVAQLLALLARAIAGEPIAPDISIAIEPVLRIGASTVRQGVLSGI